MWTDQKSCTICGGDTSQIDVIPRFPVFMGAVPRGNSDPYQFCDLVFSSCRVCHQIQIERRINLDILYCDNHNVDIVGETWKKHFDEISDFILSRTCGGSVLEIGDPSAKIARKCCHKFDSWTIVEPNPSIEDFDNVRFMKSFLNEDTALESQVDCIVHSHVIEHQYDPVGFIRTLSKHLKDGGDMILSMPNMRAILNQSPIVVLCLNFEHVCYLDISTMRHILSLSGFEVLDIYQFKNQSLFIHCKKTGCDTVSIDTNNNCRVLKLFKDNILQQQKIVRNISQQLRGPTYLYGCHVPTQYLLCSGLGQKPIAGILDNATYKLGKTLYGTNLETFAPSVVADQACEVVTSHMGIYKNEIDAQLMSLNPKCILV